MPSTRNKKKVALVGGLAGLIATAGLTAAPHATAPSQAFELPGIGEVIGAIETAHSIYDRCEANKEAGLDCFMSDAKKLAQIHKMLSDFVDQYNKDQKSNSAALQAIIDNQKDAQMQAALESVKADIATTHVGLNIYDSFVDCMSAVANGNATCSTVDQFGADRGPQPANQESIAREAKLLIANSKSEFAGGTRGYLLQPDDFVQRIGGESMNPYQGRGVLHSVAEVAENQEAKRQGLLPGSRLRFFPAAYINSLGTQISSFIDLEEGYFTARIAAAKLDNNTTLAGDLQNLAQNGRTKGSQVLSLAQQKKAYGFPGWSPNRQFAPTFAFYRGPNSGAVELINEGSKEGRAAQSPSLPTADQVEKLATDMDTDPAGGRWSVLQKADPQVLLAPTRYHPDWEPAKGDLWTAERPVWSGYGRAPRSHKGVHYLSWIKDTRTGDRINNSPMQAKLRIMALNPIDSDGFDGHTLSAPVPVNVYDDASFVDRNNEKMAHEVKEGYSNAAWRINVNFQKVPTRYSAPAFEHYTYEMGPENLGWGNWLDHTAYDANSQSQVLLIHSVAQEGMLSA